MFHWTNARTLAAMAAGIAEVAALYNTAYERMVRTYGPSFGAAHTRALDLVTFALVEREERLFEANVERMLATLGVDPGKYEDDLVGVDDFTQQAILANEPGNDHGSASAYPAF